MTGGRADGPAGGLVAGALRRVVAAGARLVHGARRRRLEWVTLLRAVSARAEVDWQVAPDLRLGRRVRVTVAPGSRSSIVVGPHCALGDDVVVALRGGRLVLGPGVDVRRGCEFEVAGHCELAGPALVQRGTTVHCDESVRVGARSVLSEGVTVVDSSHGDEEGQPWFVDVVRTAPVTIGQGVWVGAKATVARGVVLGDGSVVSANSLVVRDVAPGWLASGVPADPVHPLRQERGPSVLGDRPVA